MIDSRTIPGPDMFFAPFSTFFLLYFLKYPGNVQSGFVWLGNYPSGNCQSGNCPSGNCPSGKCPSGKCPDTDMISSELLYAVYYYMMLIIIKV